MTANKRNLLVSANQLAHTITAIDASTLSKIATIKTPPEPHMVVLDERRDLLYTAITYRDGFYDVHGDHGQEIVVIDPATWTVVKVLDISPYVGPHDLTIDAERDLLYLACESHGGCVLIIELESMRLAGHIPTQTAGPHWLAMTADGRKAYTGNKEAPFVSVLDLAERRMVGKIATPGGSEDVEIAGDRLHVNDRAEPLLRIFDTGDDTEIGRISLPDLPHRTHVLADGTVAVSHFHQPWRFDSPHPGSVSISDPKTEKVIHEVQVDPGPLGITSIPALNRLYVNSAVNGTMTVVDTGTYEVVTVVPADRGAHELIVI